MLWLLLWGFIGKNEIVGRINKRDMGERLREIAREALGPGIIFLGKQTHIIAEFGKSFENAARVGGAAKH
jgi:hypothetical protein